MKKHEKILWICAEIENLLDRHQIDEANSKIIELLGIVVGESKCSKDIESTVMKYFNKASGYAMQPIR